jgi:hypothetical protein
VGVPFFALQLNEILELSEKGKYMVVTDHIDRFLSNGILLKIRKTSSRRHYNHRNGLDVVALRGEIQLIHSLDISKSFVYKGLMLSASCPTSLFCWLCQFPDVEKATHMSEYIFEF